ncbi:(Fe-S)-binding protein [bacterium]|nr:(Fe-S)-binding protein [bacterium]
MNDIFSEKDLKEEVYKCSKCALCKQVCPAYERTKNETLLAKGRCIVLGEILSGNIKLKKRFLSTFKECRGCNKCKSACPSEIDMEKISNTVFVLYYKNHFIQRYFFEILYKLSKGKIGFKI